MSLRPYRQVLALPGVASLLLLGVFARIPLTAVSVGVTLHVVGALDRGYAAAGLVGTVTTVGLAVDEAEIGEQWRAGTALLEVCGPRIPCATFAAHMAEQHWVKRFSARERVGAYLGVVEAGIIEPGDPIEVVLRPGHGLTVPMYFRACMGDRDLAARFLESGLLPAAEHDWLAARA